MSVVRTLPALEAALGVHLLNRTTRRIALTDEGRESHEHCKRVPAEVDEAEALPTARHAAPRERLRVIASVILVSCGSLAATFVAVPCGRLDPRGRLL